METSPSKATLIEGQPFAPWFSRSELPAEIAGLFDFSSGSAVAAAPALVSLGGQLIVVLPRFYDGVGESAAARRATVQTLVTALRETRRRSAEGLDLELSWGGEAIDSLVDRLEAALLLWTDYRENGSLYVTAQRTSPRERGRIHWHRTIQTCTPVFSGTSVAYAEPIRTKVGIFPGHPLTTLHEQTCQDAGRLLGWLPPARSRLSSREALATLERFRHELFRDRHKRVWSALRRYHASRSGAGPRSEPSAGCMARSFPHIWERMIGVALAPRMPLDLPRGRYEHGGRSLAPGLRLIPDTVIREGGQILVLDAKDYAAGAWPRTESIAKQILYRLLLTSALEFAPDSLHAVVNAFVRPAALPRSIPVKNVGSHVLDRDPRGVGVIHCLALDFETVAASYARGRPLPDLRRRVAAALGTQSVGHR